MAAVGQQLPLGAKRRVVRYEPISGPALGRATGVGERGRTLEEGTGFAGSAFQRPSAGQRVGSTKGAEPPRSNEDQELIAEVMERFGYSEEEAIKRLTLSGGL
jgi:hypothetical protein